MFYDLFCDLCKKKGVSVTKATVEIGLSRTIGTKWKNTGATPNGETLNKIASYFDVPVGYLLGNDQKEKPVETDLKLDNVYLSFAKQAQNEGIPPSDIQLALETIRKLRGEK